MKTNKPKILNGYEHICLFCGEEMKGKWEENEKYYECDCKDAVKDRKILEEIQKLIQSRPKHKFKIQEQSVLIRKRR